MIARVRHDACRVFGRDAATYLHSQASNDITSLAVGSARYAFFLDPTGKIVSLVRVTRTGDTEFLLDLDRGGVDELVTRLRRFMIRVDVTIEPVDLTCVSHRGGDVSARPASSDEAFVVEAWWGDGTAVDLLLVGDPSGDDVSSELEIERVAAAWPRLGAEIESGSTLPAATGVVPRAVSFTKGCYPGQELVERMDSRGAEAPMILRRLDDAVGLSVGDEIRRDDTVVGRVTSVAGGRALAYVRRGVEI
jgi:folate-binding protein YgfZ